MKIYEINILQERFYNIKTFDIGRVSIAFSVESEDPILLQNRNKALTKQMLGLREGLSDELVESIKKLDPMTLNEYSYLNGINQKNEPLIEEALLNLKLNKPL